MVKDIIMSSDENTPDTSKSTTEPKSLDTTTRYRARVKWFNNRAGYGFATIQSHDRLQEDVFVHHSGVSVANEQYKYLVQGEYVEFNLRQSNHDKHPYQADNIRGIDGGMLMCETHAEVRKQRDREGREGRGDSRGDSRGEGRGDSHGEGRRDSRGGGRGAGETAQSHKSDRYRLHGSGPRDGEHWYLVKGDRNRRRPRAERFHSENRVERDAPHEGETDE